jgi:integrase
MPKLSKRTVDAADIRDGDYIIWDDSFPGFGLRIFPSGKKSYLFQYRHRGRTRRVAIGSHGAWTPDKALKRAIKLRNEVNDGRDPSAERRAVKEDVTVSELCDLYLNGGCGHKKPSTIATDRGRIARHIKPLLGHLPVKAVSSADVEVFVNSVISGKTAGVHKTGKRGLARVRGGKGAATRTVGLLGGIFTFAQNSKLRIDNPTRNVRTPKDSKRERFLTEEELCKLGALLGRSAFLQINANVVPIVKLLILTGCRKSEILKLRWSEVDFENGYLNLLDTKTGPRKVPLNDQSLSILRQQPIVAGNPFVFPAGRGLGHFTALQDGWERIRAIAGLPDVRLHDLRHSFATILAKDGNSLLVIGGLLGHRDLRTTQIYAHLVDKSQREASQRAGRTIAASWIGAND